MIELTGITKKFRSANSDVYALKDISMHIPKGAKCCLIGRNGAGKTTLLEIISSIILPDRGTVKIAGHNPNPHPAITPPPRLSPSRGEDGGGGAIKPLIGRMPGKDGNFYGRLTLLENLKFYAAVQMISEPSSSAKINSLIEQLGIAQWQHCHYQKLPAGIARRMSLARALIHDPEILLVDEPTRSLDADSARAIRKMLASMTNITMVAATHDTTEALEISSLCAVLCEGRLRFFGETKTAIDNYRIT